MSCDKILLITGASSEVGSELIKSIGFSYKKIWAHYNSSSESIEKLRNVLGEHIVPIQADFTSLESTQTIINTIKNSGDYPDHIVHLAAPKAKNLHFHKHSWDGIQTEIDVCLRSITMLLLEFIPKMAKKKHGKIVFMLTAYLLGLPPKFQTSYITVKHALLGLMRSLASEYAPKGIMINAVSPEMMETKFLSNLPEWILEQNASNSPLGRNIRVDEVVPAIIYLLSAASDSVTGQNIGITGGAR